MDEKLVEILQATMDPVQRKQAEEQLSQIQKISGFLPTLLQLIMANEVPISVRQAGAIYLKNLITLNWQNKHDKGEPILHSIQEPDRVIVRDSIVDAIVQAQNDVIRVQLALCLKTIIKHDFPKFWTQVVDKIHRNLQNSDPNACQGALLSLYQLVKNYKFCTVENRKPFFDAMNHLLPILYNLIVQLQAGEQNEQSAQLQKQILKDYCTLINLRKITLLKDLTTKEMFSNWMEILRRTLNQPVPDHTLQVDEDKRQTLPWWKAKKWAAYTLYRIFERYGSPTDVGREQIQFSEWYLTTFTGGILEVLLRLLEQYRNNVYVSPVVLKMSLEYIDECVSHSYAWKLLKPHVLSMIRDVLFPLMCYSETDEALWKTDPNDFIRLKYIKYDIFSDFVSPVAAAQNLLVSCCKKRKHMLEHTMQICMQVLTSQGGEYNPRQRDGAFHVIGTLNEIIIKHKLYKEQIDTLISQYVITEFNSPLGHLRARAYWLIQCYAGIKFKSDKFLITICECTINSLLTDEELPVKVEAAIAIHMLLSSQKKVLLFLAPHVKEVTLELLKLIRKTEIDNLTNILQKIIPLYTEQLIPLAVETTEHLSTTFLSIIETDAASDKKAMTAMGLFDTIETVLNVMENNSEIMAQLDQILLRVVVHILQNNLIEFYEEAMILLFYPTGKTISEDMWKILEIIYQNFEKNGFDYFTDMTPVLHNYITVDTEAFLSNKNHVIAIFNMAKAVLTLNSENESEMCAAKILEVMVLQCNGKIDNFLFPCVELVLNRLAREGHTSKLKTMLLQILIAILYCNPQLLFAILDKLQEAVPNTPITQHFIKQWIHDKNCYIGIHDRKLCILGICKLLEMGSERPQIDDIIPKLIPYCLVLFDGLQRAYEARAYDESSSEKDKENEDEVDEELLSSDEDDLKDLRTKNLVNLARIAVKNSSPEDVDLHASIEDTSESDGDIYDDANDYDDDPVDIMIECQTPLDEKDCPIDEYVQFKNCLSSLATAEPPLYSALTSVLSPSQLQTMDEIFVNADRRKDLQISKLIKQRGGYFFALPAQVSTEFKFGV